MDETTEKAPCTRTMLIIIAKHLIYLTPKNTSSNTRESSKKAQNTEEIFPLSRNYHVASLIEEVYINQSQFY